MMSGGQAVVGFHRQVVDALEATPDSLRALVRSTGERDESSEPDGWNSREVFAHLSASDAIVAPRIMQILVRENPPLPAFDERVWAELTRSDRVELELQLARFEISRAELVGMLRRLTQEQWARHGEHEVRGPMSVLQIAKSIVDHEAEHHQQLLGLRQSATTRVR